MQPILTLFDQFSAAAPALALQFIEVNAAFQSVQINLARDARPFGLPHQLAIQVVQFQPNIFDCLTGH